MVLTFVLLWTWHFWGHCLYFHAIGRRAIIAVGTAATQSGMVFLALYGIERPHHSWPDPFFLMYVLLWFCWMALGLAFSLNSDVGDQLFGPFKLDTSSWSGVLKTTPRQNQRVIFDYKLTQAMATPIVSPLFCVIACSIVKRLRRGQAELPKTGTVQAQ